MALFFSNANLDKFWKIMEIIYFLKRESPSITGDYLYIISWGQHALIQDTIAQGVRQTDVSCKDRKCLYARLLYLSTGVRRSPEKLHRKMHTNSHSEPQTHLIQPSPHYPHRISNGSSVILHFEACSATLHLICMGELWGSDGAMGQWLPESSLSSPGLELPPQLACVPVCVCVCVCKVTQSPVSLVPFWWPNLILLTDVFQFKRAWGLL